MFKNKSGVWPAGLVIFNGRDPGDRSEAQNILNQLRDAPDFLEISKYLLTEASGVYANHGSVFIKWKVCDQSTPLSESEAKSLMDFLIQYFLEHNNVKKEVINLLCYSIAVLSVSYGAFYDNLEQINNNFFNIDYISLWLNILKEIPQFINEIKRNYNNNYNCLNKSTQEILACNNYIYTKFWELMNSQYVYSVDYSLLMESVSSWIGNGSFSSQQLLDLNILRILSQMIFEYMPINPPIVNQDILFFIDNWLTVLLKKYQHTFKDYINKHKKLYDVINRIICCCLLPYEYDSYDENTKNIFSLNRDTIYGILSIQCRELKENAFNTIKLYYKRFNEQSMEECDKIRYLDGYLFLIPSLFNEYIPSNEDFQNLQYNNSCAFKYFCMHGYHITFFKQIPLEKLVSIFIPNSTTMNITTYRLLYEGFSILLEYYPLHFDKIVEIITTPIFNQFTQLVTYNVRDPKTVCVGLMILACLSYCICTPGQLLSLNETRLDTMETFCYYLKYLIRVFPQCLYMYIPQICTQITSLFQNTKCGDYIYLSACVYEKYSDYIDLLLQNNFDLIAWIKSIFNAALEFINNDHSLQNRFIEKFMLSIKKIVINQNLQSLIYSDIIFTERIIQFLCDCCLIQEKEVYIQVSDLLNLMTDRSCFYQQSNNQITMNIQNLNTLIEKHMSVLIKNIMNGLLFHYPDQYDIISKLERSTLYTLYYLYHYSFDSYSRAMGEYIQWLTTQYHYNEYKKS
ncbi:hypothetical protein WA158_008378 [Blastocystis sp. Blastoise]